MLELTVIYRDDECAYCLALTAGNQGRMLLVIGVHEICLAHRKSSLFCSQHLGVKYGMVVSDEGIQLVFVSYLGVFIRSIVKVNSQYNQALFHLNHLSLSLIISSSVPGYH